MLLYLKVIKVCTTFTLCVDWGLVELNLKCLYSCVEAPTKTKPWIKFSVAFTSFLFFPCTGKSKLYKKKYNLHVMKNISIDLDVEFFMQLVLSHTYRMELKKELRKDKEKSVPAFFQFQETITSLRRVPCPLPLSFLITFEDMKGI